MGLITVGSGYVDDVEGRKKTADGRIPVRLQQVRNSRDIDRLLHPESVQQRLIYNIWLTAR